MIQFSRLRINGFKSFVDRTELDIGPGLTGVVGPNGCGKSNLVEALRWVMGENSAKRMRGGEGGMEDVIFNGTAQRSARNLAEVSLLLNNGSRSAPAAYNGADEIEVSRKIERDHGSTYKINGKTVRARDVHMLFADTVTGANSPAMVSQGRVAQIINSKPVDRRLILEESAGISGLYARRHEAELRLRAADANLQRLQDILGSMESRLNDLKRQQRQATRYRNVNAQIRQLEIMVAWLDWKSLDERIQACRKTFEEAESAVAEKLATVTQLTKTQNTQAEDLPALRQAEAEVAAKLQTVKIALQRIEDESERHEKALNDTEEQIRQSLIDHEHETQSLEESTSIFERLETEHAAIVAEQERDSGKLEQKEAIKNDLEQKVRALEEQYTAMMQSAAEGRALKQSLEQQIAQNTTRIESVNARKDKATTDLEQFKASRGDDTAAKEIQGRIDELENSSKKLNEEIEAARARITELQREVNEARGNLTRAESESSEFRAESAMLENLLRGDDNGKYKPVLDQLNADSGFEKAISRALGDALLASLESSAPARWVTRTGLRNLPSLPFGVSPLLPSVNAPIELHPALSQIGLVRDEEEGTRLKDSLEPGQALVSKDGFYWRWDGYFVQAQASDRNAVHLEQKNRFRDLQKRRPEIEEALKEATEALKKSETVLAEQESARREGETNLRKTEQELNAARHELVKSREAQVRAESEIARLAEIIRLSEEDIATLSEVIKWDQERLAACEKAASERKEEETDKIRRALLEARETYQSAVSAFDMFQQQQNSRNARLHAIADERVNTQNRLIRSRERLKNLEERQGTLAEKLEALKRQPKDFNEDKEKLLGRISEIEAERAEAADRLAAVDNEVTETGKALKQAEAALSEARESRVHAQATLAALTEQQGSVNQHIQEQFEVPAAELAEHTAVEMNESVENLESLRAKKEKLIRERENIGAVNLRADEEYEALEKEVGAILKDRDDLLQAIEELRGAINKINAEARDRLKAAFDHVNTHFQRLFTQLFGGGKAHLALIDADDPLGAGLEIYAQPPGKTLQSLSLLSGGEQALASISLIFAMFLTNPSPICVLDEIDAPLDDANVDRVCNLLEEIAARGETRFLVITHHRMTMARMNRLYGVTMAERGVSQLVSVDLQQSFEFLEAA
ncbi:MAG: chromosome segregation protein SMC [Alphaproteobacteria bacterium PRO2]|nr:chromosome segregation protein SMC [Alphaproteobacteria bacterium PRO2]